MSGFMSGFMSQTQVQAHVQGRARRTAGICGAADVTLLPVCTSAPVPS